MELIILVSKWKPSSAIAMCVVGLWLALRESMALLGILTPES